MGSITIDLPWPPSQNSIWRSTKNRVYRSKPYMDWIKQAEIHWMIQRPKSKLKTMSGEFTCSIILNPPDKRRSDIDNRNKVLLDFCQRMAIIENDYLCKMLIVTYGDIPLGARVILSPYP